MRYALESDNPSGILVFVVPNFFTFQRLYGPELADMTLRKVEAALDECRAQYLADCERVHFENARDGCFFFILSRAGLSLDVLADLAMTMVLAVRHATNREVVKLTGQKLEIKAGYSTVRLNMGVDVSDGLYQSLCDAQQVAAGQLNVNRLRMMEEFRGIVEEPRIMPVYQPIVDLNTGRVLGWEALTRGPEGSRFHSPTVLFDFAEEVGFLFHLERVCRQQAISNFGPLDPQQKIFLNIHPHTVGDPAFTAGQTRQLLGRYGLKPENVVFEITERHPVREFTLFFQTLEHYRSQGYQVAIDDVGAGYSGLWTIANIRPEFVKVDMSLVRCVDSNPVHRALLETLVSFSNKIGCRLIAEGIESETELSTLMDLGVHFGQGFHLARPANPKPPVSVDLPVKAALNDQTFREWKVSLPVGTLAEPALQVEPTTRISEVQHLIQSGPATPIAGVVVLEEQRPVGLVMSHNLNRELGTRFGVSLYYDRPVSRLMDRTPLIIDEAASVAVAAERAMSRDTYHVYDQIIVTRGGKLLGVVSVQKMLDSLARIQVEMAKGANPLTGLPGNVAIEQEIERRSRAGVPSSFIYADLDHFKVYNDQYGFEKGDRVILLLARILQWAVNRHTGPDGYLGHVGGDDFVVITPPERAERLARAVTRCFSRLGPTLYSRGDRERGYVEGATRNGDKGRFDLVSVSLAIVDCHGQADLIQVGERAAEVKKWAKSVPGCSWVRDRRRPVGESPDAAAEAGDY
ncbi:MAG: EAL and GGDEF domain-containing protein [Proteobacteria bacterium]|nr:EAL and GGDEF domain-containing protein [Pseudomonadota bacterium]